MSLSPLEPRPLGAWLEVLDAIEQALARALTLAQPPEAGAADNLESVENPGPGAFLAGLGQRWAGLQAHLDQAERDAAEADAQLGAEVEALKGWRETLATVQRRLEVLTTEPGTVTDGTTAGV